MPVDIFVSKFQLKSWQHKNQFFFVVFFGNTLGANSPC